MSQCCQQYASPKIAQFCTKLAEGATANQCCATSKITKEITVTGQISKECAGTFRTTVNINETIPINCDFANCPAFKSVYSECCYNPPPQYYHGCPNFNQLPCGIYSYGQNQKPCLCQVCDQVVENAYPCINCTIQYEINYRIKEASCNCGYVKVVVEIELIPVRFNCQCKTDYAPFICNNPLGGTQTVYAMIDATCRASSWSQCCHVTVSGSCEVRVSFAKGICYENQECCVGKVVGESIECNITASQFQCDFPNCSAYQQCVQYYSS